MNSVVEKLTAIEQEVAAIQPKIAPLTGRIDDLAQKVTDLAQQLTDIVAESVAVKQDIELTQQSLSRIQTLIGKSRVESEQLFAGQEENLQRCETMQAVFGTAFQAVSQFFDAAQRMGLADQAKAVFLTPPSPVETVTEETAPPIPELPPALESPLVSEEPPIADNALDEPPAWNQPMEESGLAESDFDSPSSDAAENELAPLSALGLPDVADQADLNSDADTEPSSDIASQLDVPPLNLSVPPLPEQGEMETEDETDEIEALLESMGTPVTAAAGN
jgi:regulator of replication initiation timing